MDPLTRDRIIALAKLLADAAASKRAAPDEEKPLHDLACDAIIHELVRVSLSDHPIVQAARKLVAVTFENSFNRIEFPLVDYKLFERAVKNYP